MREFGKPVVVEVTLWPLNDNPHAAPAAPTVCPAETVSGHLRTGWKAFELLPAFAIYVAAVAGITAALLAYACS